MCNELIGVSSTETMGKSITQERAIAGPPLPLEDVAHGVWGNIFVPIFNNLKRQVLKWTQSKEEREAAILSWVLPSNRRFIMNSRNHGTNTGLQRAHHANSTVPAPHQTISE